MLLSLVIPCYNEGGNVARFYSETARVFDGADFDYEFVFVDDGSKDNTFSELKVLHEKDRSVRAFSFSRNFGKEAAMYAGLKQAKGDLVCIIDADLQQRPEVVLEMLSHMKADENIDCVAAYQKKRRENKLVGAMKTVFYKIINKISDVNFVIGASDFRLMKRRMVDAILDMSEYHRFSKGIFGYVGFNTKFIPYRVEKREVGESKWNIKKLFKYAFDGILAFSTFPLKLASYTGILSLISAMIYGLVLILEKRVFNMTLPEYSPVIILMLVIGGIQLLCLGVTSEYIAKMYVQGKDRPVYILRDSLDGERDGNA